MRPNAESSVNGCANLRIQSFWFLVTSGVCFSFLGCAVVKRVGIHLLYQPARLPSSEVRTNVSYAGNLISEGPRHELNLFLPKGTNWPVLVFVHGGGWDSGSKDLVVGGADVYGNIGRFFASHGIGTAIINYRLQPGADWHEQVADVAGAVGWVQNHASKYGGNPSNIFLMGHSAGGQLAALVALNSKTLTSFGISPNAIHGVILVSGAGLDLMDKATYALGQKFHYYEQRFNSGTRGWQREASPVTYVHAGAPPFLILYAQGDNESLKRQSHLLAKALSSQKIPNETFQIPGQSHTRIVLTLSRPDKLPTRLILDFITKRSCPHGAELPARETQNE
jgi:acetyl esterase/lipase